MLVVVVDEMVDVVEVVDEPVAGAEVVDGPLVRGPFWADAVGMSTSASTRQATPTAEVTKTRHFGPILRVGRTGVELIPPAG